MPNRKDILLRAAYDIIKKCHEAPYVISPEETTAFYDDADCDGTCLMEDIMHEIGLEKDTKPLRKKVRGH